MCMSRTLTGAAKEVTLDKIAKCAGVPCQMVDEYAQLLLAMLGKDSSRRTR